jgi:hypothetical protein
MLGSLHKTFKSDSKYPTPEAAARELLRIYREHVTEEWPYRQDQLCGDRRRRHLG